ncbi:hypothetical protein OEA41_008758 [Lepraria neglecta]|uniref:Nephrocystin 3-like N-terminal domain-containing protein n=1 Tax=Lepraria neglecta TaxID=209136 RepID=A0AAE0DHF7_9LECA|nr:hypothetical protein OEA41_008758 [Lepraria neglecta]
MAVSNSPQINLWDIASSKLLIKDEEVLKSGLVLPSQLDDLRDPIEKARDSTSRWKPKTRKYLNNMVLLVQKFIIGGDIPQRANAEEILRCFVKQLSTRNLNHETKKTPRYVVEKYKEAEVVAFTSGGLMVNESCGIITKFAADQSKICIVIDGLDECTEEARYTITQAFGTIIERVPTATIKLLISSRSDLQLDTFFEKLSNCEITVGSHN